MLHLPEVYIHASEGRPALESGMGWTQEAVIRIGNARIEGEFPPESREAYGGYAHYLYDGSLAINGTISNNLIPLPLDVHGEIELTMEGWGYIVRVHGSSAKLELIGKVKHVEGQHP